MLAVSHPIWLTGIKAVHTGVMRAEAKTVRPSVSLPAKLASQVLFDLAERFRNETDPEAAKRLGDQLGLMVFGG